MEHALWSWGWGLNSCPVLSILLAYFYLLSFRSVSLNMTLKEVHHCLFSIKRFLTKKLRGKPNLMMHEYANSSIIIGKSRVKKILPWTNFFSAKCHWPVSRTTNSFAIWVEIFYDNNSETLLTRWVTTKFVEPELRSCDTYSVLALMTKWIQKQSMIRTYASRTGSESIGMVKISIN